MQEVRSSNTEKAKQCEKLHAPRRWMVSGTPLSQKIDELMGELFFLRVSPFGAGESDGFWDFAVKQPWESKEPVALERLKVLLEAVMMRHSKSQLNLDGTPILTLPEKIVEHVPITLDGSELGVYAYAECEAVRALRYLTAQRHNNPFDAEYEKLKAAREANSFVKILREAAVAPVILGGGDGCEAQLDVLDRMGRITPGANWDSTRAVEEGDELKLNLYLAEEAIKHLDRLQRAKQGNTSTAEIGERLKAYKKRLLAHRANWAHACVARARCRWHIALELVIMRDQEKYPKAFFGAQPDCPLWDHVTHPNGPKVAVPVEKSDEQERRLSPRKRGWRPTTAAQSALRRAHPTWQWLKDDAMLLWDPVGRVAAFLPTGQVDLASTFAPYTADGRKPLALALEIAQRKRFESSFVRFAPPREEDGEEGQGVRPDQATACCTSWASMGIRRAAEVGEQKAALVFIIEMGHADAVKAVKKAATADGARAVQLYMPEGSKLAEELAAARKEQKRLLALAWAKQEVDRLTNGRRALLIGTPRAAKELEELKETVRREAAEGNRHMEGSFDHLHHTPEDKKAKPGYVLKVENQVLLLANRRATLTPDSPLQPGYRRRKLTCLKLLHVPECALLEEIEQGVADFINEVKPVSAPPRSFKLRAHELPTAGEVIVDVGSKQLSAELLKQAESRGFVSFTFAREGRDAKVQRAREALLALQQPADVPLRSTERYTVRKETKSMEVPINKLKDLAKQRVERLEAEVRLIVRSSGKDGILVEEANRACRTEGRKEGRREGQVGRQYAQVESGDERLKKLRNHFKDWEKTMDEEAVNVRLLEPLTDKLQRAESRGLSSVTVEHSSYQVLWQMAQGKPLSDLVEDMRLCAICFEELGTNGPVVSTPCAHLYCRQCIVQVVQARKVVPNVHGVLTSRTEDTNPRCPCCRKPFEASPSRCELIQIATASAAEPQPGVS